MAIDITGRLEAFIATEMEKPFRWGETDCASTADRWARLLIGYSPLHCFGRIYSGEGAAREWLSEPGGIAVAMNRVMRRSGFKRTAAPRAGDVGLVIHDGRASVAINTGKIWFSRDVNGFVGMPLTSHWKAWDIISWATL